MSKNEHIKKNESIISYIGADRWKFINGLTTCYKSCWNSGREQYGFLYDWD